MSRPPTPFARRRGPVAADPAAHTGGRLEFTDPLSWLIATVPERLGGRPLPRVVAVTTSREAIGLLLSETRGDPPTGFEAIDSGLTWIAEPSLVGCSYKTTRDGRRGAPWPLLVPLGHAVPDGPAVEANLEELGAIELSGDPADVLAFAESLAAELAADRFGARPRIVCVNCAWELDALEGVRIVESLSGVLADAETQRRTVDAAEAQQAPLPELRRHGARGTVRPLVVIDPHGREPRARAELARLSGPGLAVVSANHRTEPVASSPPRHESGYGWSLHVTGRRLRWEPVGVDLQLEDRSDPGVYPELHSGRGHAPGPVGPAAVIDPLPRSRDSGWVREPAESGLRVAVAGAGPGEVEVQVLGVVQVVGAASPFTSQRALDLVCYLALHRDGATADKLRHWLWRRSEPVPNAKTFANVVSRARVCLGRDADGEPYLSKLDADGVYRLSAQVTTDLERFATSRRLAGRVRSPQTLECLYAALRLVRGTPFGGGSGSTFSWTDASWRSHVEYLVDDTAHHLADMALELDFLEVARWATLRGLAVAPDCEQCYQRRIAVARRSGHGREADRAMRQLERLQHEPLPALDVLVPDAFDAVALPTA